MGIVRQIAVCAIVSILPTTPVHSAEGMWTFDHLPRERMQSEYGFTASQAWADHLQRSAVLVRGLCSGSFVSARGLVATNQHCLRECIAQLSSAGRDLVSEGFYAATGNDERRCEGTELDRLDAITDVTAQMAAATGAAPGGSSSEARQAAQSTIEAQCAGDDSATVRCVVVPLYHGMVFALYRYHRYRDVRLVFAPESAIAAFGGDADNFEFPRYEFDVAFLRAYEDGRPAAVADYLPLSARGATAGEMTFVVGNPAQTRRASTVAEFETLRDDTLIMRIGQFSELRGRLARFGEEGDAQRTAAQNDLHEFENALKATKGEQAALADPVAFGDKRAEEAALRRFVAATPSLGASTTDAWDKIAAAEVVRRRTAQPYRMLERGSAFFTRYFELARMLVRGAAERRKPDTERLPEFATAALPDLEEDLFSTAPIDPRYEQMLLAFSLSKYRELVGIDDPLVRQVFAEDAPVALAARMVARTQLGDVALRRALWDGGSDAIARSDDPFVRLAVLVDPAARALRKTVENEVDAVEDAEGAKIAAARLAMAGTSSYPDATFTLRLSYGEVGGWQENGRAIAAFTETAALFARATHDAPLALPDRWVAARSRLMATRHVDLVTSNDVTGGNSGSPVVDRAGEVVGILCDGNRHALGNAYGFDGRTSRAIAVDSGLVLEALEQVYGANRLVEELEAAHR